MNAEETKQILAILKAAYPSSYSGMTKKEAYGVITVWSVQFADLPADVVLMAVQKAISSSKFPPTIAEVKEKVKSIYWEAYDAIADPSLQETDRKQYERIYACTRKYKFMAAGEPRIAMLLGKNEPEKLIGG